MTGSALTTPLYARTVEKVNSFERSGLDVYPRESVPAHTVPVDHDHRRTADLQWKAFSKHTMAAKAAEAKSATDSSRPWRQIAAHHRSEAAKHETTWRSHLRVVQTGVVDETVPNLTTSRTDACAGIDDAERTIAMVKNPGHTVLFRPSVQSRVTETSEQNTFRLCHGSQKNSNSMTFYTKKGKNC